MAEITAGRPAAGAFAHTAALSGVFQLAGCG
jgi:hypothetical protein